MIINSLASQNRPDGSVVLISGAWDKVVKVWSIDVSGNIKLIGDVDFGQCVNKICVGKQGQAFIAGNDGSLCRIDI